MTDEVTAATPADEGTDAPVEDIAEAQVTEADNEDGDEQEDDDLSDLLKEATGADDATPELSQVEYEGKTYQLPPELKDALLRQADYTKKTMEVADTRKSIEAKLAEVDQLSTASKEQIEAVVAANVAHARVEALLATPIEGLSQDQINALRLDLSDAQNAAAQHVAKAQETARKAEESRSQHFAKTVTEARTEAAKHIPNLDDAKIAAFDSLVISLGGEPGAVKSLDHPATYRVLHLAHIGQQFIERQRQAGKAKAAQSVQPATELAAKGNPTPKGLNDALSPEEWVKRRNAQVQKKG